MTCNRVIIINKGRIEASDTPQNLLAQIRALGGIRIEAKTGADNGVEQLTKIPGVKDATAEKTGDWTAFALRIEANSDPREAIYQLAVERKWTVRELTRRNATLEDAFVEITHSDA
jgi:ABC-2 type transport system ATP-binding protein